MSAPTWIAFWVAAAVGAVLRYLIDAAVIDRTEGLFPWGTLLINVTGSLVLGVVTGLGLYHGLSTAPRLVVGTGFCGAYTTFSTFTFETVRLAEEGASPSALRNALGTLVAGGVAAGLGLAITAL
ncbi:MAG TPA: fluoride efflux transporter CrcB [Acidimicrobiales bacterium]|nr:fluoride efflux transporter CrcB [Acidimicrobiales bacterium]